MNPGGVSEPRASGRFGQRRMSHLRLAVAGRSIYSRGISQKHAKRVYRKPGIARFNEMAFRPRRVRPANDQGGSRVSRGGDPPATGLEGQKHATGPCFLARLSAGRAHAHRTACCDRDHRNTDCPAHYRPCRWSARRHEGLLATIISSRSDWPWRPMKLAHAAYPFGVGGGGPPSFLPRWSPHSQLLAFLEQDAVYNSLNFSGLPWAHNDTFGTENLTGVLTSIAVFLCPSDVGYIADRDGNACNNYRATARDQAHQSGRRSGE